MGSIVTPMNIAVWTTITLSRCRWQIGRRVMAGRQSQSPEAVSDSSQLDAAQVARPDCC
jgi:hypothetical protein